MSEKEIVALVYAVVSIGVIVFMLWGFYEKPKPPDRFDPPEHRK